MLYVLSQVLAGVNLVLVVTAYQLKDKKKVLFVFIFANLTVTLSYLCLADWIAALLFGIATVRMIAFYLIDRFEPKMRVSVLTLLFFLAANVVSTVLTWTLWFDFLLMAGACAYTFGSWKKGGHFVRISQVIYAVLLIIHNIYVSNWVGAVSMLCVIISIAVYYIRKLAAKQK